ncbi:MAG TPA: GNAT family protein [Flavobacterium sp.]
MKFLNWQIDRIGDVEPQEFFELVQDNIQHIARTFPVTVASCASLELASDFFSAAVEKEGNGEGYHFFIRSIESEKLIGYICVKNVDKRNMKCELAYFVDLQFAKQGVISAAIDDIVEICFSALAMNKICICTGLDNRPSQRIATRNGFRLEGILRQEFKNGDGKFEDVNYYGLLKSDYDERQVL